MNDVSRFDLIVIGSGPGGYVAAIRAAQLGMKTACVEKYPTLGGTCLNVGCIPSKALLDSSEHFALARHGLAAHGIKALVELDLPTMMERKDKVVGELTRGVDGLFKKNKVERVNGTARIASPGQVEVAGAEGARSLATRRILIATGSKPAALPVPRPRRASAATCCWARSDAARTRTDWAPPRPACASTSAAASRSTSTTARTSKASSRSAT